MGKSHLTSKYRKQRRKERANRKARRHQQVVPEIEQIVTAEPARPSMEEAFK